MNGLITVLILLLVLFLVGRIRIGAQVEYREEGLFVHLRAGAVRILVFPAKAKKPKAKRTKKKKTDTPVFTAGAPAPKQKKGGALELVVDFLPLALDAVKRVCRKLRVDRLEMELTIGTPDPADAALRYGQANALLGSLWRPLTQAFHVKDAHAHVGVDFDAEKPVIYIFASLSLTVGQTLKLAVIFGWKAVVILIRNRTRRRARAGQREAV